MIRIISANRVYDRFNNEYINSLLPNLLDV